MSWHERMNCAIEYIENNICNDIDLEKIAKITCQSVTSFQRTFSIVTEISVSEYIRKRRMSLAAIEMQDSVTKVIDISLKYGYDSPEAFTRAFKEIYGISPSAARKEGTMLKKFPRISFQKTFKGDIVVDYELEKNSVKITNIYRESMPALRFIGKRYTWADLNSDGLLMDRWSEWFQNGWINLLSSLPGLPGYEGIPHTGYHNGDEMEFWIGMMFPKDTTVPEDFNFVDLPAGDMAVSWLRGYRETGELFRPEARNLCLTRLQESGYAMKLDFDGEPCKWTFERYDNRRFFVPDDEGKIIMDYCVYVVGRELNHEEYASDKHVQRTCYGTDLKQPLSAGKTPITIFPTPEMCISGLAPYWTDAESNLLLCAMTTLFLKLKGYDETTPFYCIKNDGSCKKCGECGNLEKKSNLARHHLYMYHFLLTVTGVGLMWGDYNGTGEYDLKYIKGITPPLLEDRLDFAMRVEGFEYMRLDRLSGERNIFRHIVDSVRDEKPVLMKLCDSNEWLVVTGFEQMTGTLFGLDAKDHYTYNPESQREYSDDNLFIITDWFKRLRKAIIVTGRTPNELDFSELLQRMLGRMQQPERSVLETIIPQMLNAITPENARGVADYLNNLTGYVIESRWHGAECFSSSLLHKSKDENVRECLRECADLFTNIHDTCWNIWGQLGVGPHTNYKLPNNISQKMLDKERQEALKKLFTQVFNNDRSVFEKLQLLH